MSPNTIEAPKVFATSDPNPVDPRAKAPLKHGLTGARLYFHTQEDADAFGALRQAILSQLAPVNDMERDLALQIACDRYRIVSAAELESKIYGLAFDKARGQHPHDVEAETWLKNGDQIARIELYSSRIQRRYEKNFALFHQMQADRQAALEAATEEAAQLAKLAQSETESPAEGQAGAEPLTPTEPFTRRNFVFSTSQIADLIARHNRLKSARALAAPPKTAKLARASSAPVCPAPEKIHRSAA